MNRLCVCASRSAMTESSGLVVMSSHGEIWSIGRSKESVPKIRSAQIICVHVVPHFGGVAMTMSPSRNAKRSQRALSETRDRYCFTAQIYVEFLDPISHSSLLT